MMGMTSMSYISGFTGKFWLPRDHVFVCLGYKT